MAKAFYLWTLREKLKSGALKDVYVHARWIKRRLRGESLEGTLPYALVPVTQEELRDYTPQLPDEPRLYFSLALNFLEAAEANRDGNALLPALACLRCAEAVGFPSPERIALYKAVCAHRRGLPDAFSSIAQFADYEFTTEENALRKELPASTGSAYPVQAKSLLAHTWPSLEAEIAGSGASSLLAVGDSAAISADWLPGARYLLMEPGITGLTAEAIAKLGLAFDIGVASAAQQKQLRAAGVKCARWMTIEVGRQAAAIP